MDSIFDAEGRTDEIKLGDDIFLRAKVTGMRLDPRGGILFMVKIYTITSNGDRSYVEVPDYVILRENIDLNLRDPNAGKIEGI